MSKRQTVSRTPEDVERHRQGFKDYANLEMDLGGPDPQLTLAVSMIRGEATPDLTELAWRSGCYISVYTVSGGEILWTELSPRSSAEETRVVVAREWSRLGMRQERRAVKSPQRLAEHLTSYRRWVMNELFLCDRTNYEDLWASMRTHVRYTGRYAAVKTLEVLRRVGVVSAAMPDMRPEGAWSPRLTLSYLVPEHDEPLNGGDSVATLATVRDIAEDIRLELVPFVGREMDPFTFEVLLCNYRQGLRDKYPGRGHDSELSYSRKAQPYWDEREGVSPFLQQREKLWDPRCLGEQHSWTGVRKELGTCPSQHGYFWSDLVFNYDATEDLADPVRWT